eukprot:1808299-Amphidinium_carterae.1
MWEILGLVQPTPAAFSRAHSLWGVVAVIPLSVLCSDVVGHWMAGQRLAVGSSSPEFLEESWELILAAGDAIPALSRKRVKESQLTQTSQSVLRKSGLPPVWTGEPACGLTF